MKNKFLAAILSMTLCGAMTSVTGMAAESDNVDIIQTEDTMSEPEIGNRKEIAQEKEQTQIGDIESENLAETINEKQEDVSAGFSEDMENAEHVQQTEATVNEPEMPIEFSDTSEDEEAGTVDVLELVEAPAAFSQADVSVKWTGFKWTSHTSAEVTLRVDTDGICYYKWVQRNENGTSEIPDLDIDNEQLSINADEEFTIYLKDLNTDEGIDLYLKIENSEGEFSGIKKIKLDQKKRPAAAPAHTPVVPKVTESVLKGLSSPLVFYPNTFYEFSVIGAGTTNKNPGEGDVKWEPLYWSTSANPTDDQKHATWKVGSTKGITKQGTYNLYVFFQKWIYTGGQWVETDTISSAVYQFSSAGFTPAPVKLSTPSVSGTSNSTAGVVVKWKQVKNASGYKIYRKTGSTGKWSNIAKVTGSKTLIYTDGSAKNGTTYTYSVCAYKGSSVSAYNKTGSKIVRLQAPAQYTPSSKTSGKVTAKWKKVSSVSGYQLQYSVSKSFSGAKTVSSSGTVKTLSGLKKGKTYYIRVRTYKKTGGKTYYSAWGSAKTVKVRK